MFLCLAQRHKPRSASCTVQELRARPAARTSDQRRTRALLRVHVARADSDPYLALDHRLDQDLRRPVQSQAEPGRGARSSRAKAGHTGPRRTDSGSDAPGLGFVRFLHLTLF